MAKGCSRKKYHLGLEQSNSFWGYHLESKIEGHNQRTKHNIEPLPRAPDKCVIENCFSYFSTKIYVVGTQKNRLNETVLLSTQHLCLDGLVRK